MIRMAGWGNVTKCIVQAAPHALSEFSLNHVELPSLLSTVICLNQQVAESIFLMQAILENESSELPFPFIVDVRNIAEAHIKAAVIPSAKGRYLVSNANTVPNSQVMGILKERFPGLQFKDAKQEESKPVLVNDKVD